MIPKALNRIGKIYAYSVQQLTTSVGQANYHGICTGIESDNWCKIIK